MGFLSMFGGGGGFSGSSSATSGNSGETVFGAVSTGGGTAGQFTNLVIPGLAIGGVLLAVMMLRPR